MKKKKKTGLKGSAKIFSVNYRSINTKKMSNIHRFVMKETV